MKQKHHLHRTLSGICLSLLAALLLTSVPQSGYFPALAEEPLTDEAELSVDLTGRGDGYSAVLYDNTNGLPTSEANDILQASDGFIWIGSYSGLIRFDGNSFERVDSTTGIASVVCLYEDSSQRIWVGTNDSGAAVMEKGVFQVYNLDDGLRSLSVRSIAEDDKENIFLGTTDGLAVVSRDGALSMLDDERINEEYVRRLRVSEDGTIYGITMSGSVFTIRDGRIEDFYTSEDLGISDIHSILPDPANPGYAYIGNKSETLYYIKLSEGISSAREITIAPINYVNSMEFAGDMVWICADNGIGFLTDGRFIPVSNIPMSTSVEDMMIDYQKNLWFASSKQGIMKIVPNQFSDIFEKYDLGSEVVESTCMFDGKLLVGTKSSGLLALRESGIVSSLPVSRSVSASGEVFEDTDLLEMMKNVRIRSICHDSRDRLWLSTFSEQGLVCYDNGEITKYTMADGMPSDRVRTICELPDGSIAAACTGGLVIIKDGEIIRTYGEEDGIENTELLTVTETNDGDLVIGTDGGGMYVIGSDGVTHFGVTSGLGSDVVMRVKNDRDRNLIWIVMSNSIGYMDSSRNISMIHNFPYSNNFDLYENDRGEMWILSSNGIYVERVDELIANEEINPLYFGRDNGLPCITTSNSYSELTSTGDLYIAGTSGVAKVNIDKPFENVSDIMVDIPYIKADNEYLLPEADGSFSIPSTAKKVTIYSYIFNYSLVNPEVTYYLEGLDKVHTSVKRSELAPITYTNLRGGDYRFVLQIMDPQGQSSKELSINIHKHRAFYEQAWVHILFLIVLAALIALGVKRYIEERTRKYQERERAQKQLIREITESFAKVIDMKDSYTNGHSSRVAEYTVALAKELGYDDDTIEEYYCIALLHDIGKVGIPPEVLNKPGKLTDTEFNIIKSHSALGYNTLKDISILPDLAIGAGAHHERPDGKGYPKGLKGDEIPRVAQIIAVADTFDAMYSDRPYRKRMNFDKAVSIVREVRGTQLAEDVVDAFLRLVDKGMFRLPDDHGGGSTEDIDNIHRKQKREAGQGKDSKPDVSEQKDTKPADAPEQKDTKPADASEQKA